MTYIRAQGGTLIFSGYIDSAPASTAYPQKIPSLTDNPKKIPSIDVQIQCEKQYPAKGSAQLGVRVNLVLTRNGCIKYYISLSKEIILQ